MSAACSSRARLAVWGMAAHGGAAGSRALEAARRAERWLKHSGDSFPRWKGLKSGSQATAFPFAEAESETNKRLPLSRGQFPATASSFVAAKIWAERRLPRLASKLLATAFSFVAAVFEAGERCPRQQSQFLTMAFSSVVAGFGGHGRSLWLEFQRLATAFSFVAGDFGADRRLPWWASHSFVTVAADSGLHLGGLSEGLAVQGSQFHESHLCGRGVAS